MALTPGTKLGQYEVVESMGAGGMGEVYRARDAKLGRDVAIKILSADFARDPDRLARFDREARLLAQLNHPNIATLYGLDEADGQKLLVMELVEGDTLAERIASEPMTVDEARGLFMQIAEGLEAAHEKGVIHRDLKPANIKITPDGKVKILDFGLAKAFAPEDDAPADASQSPTLTRGTALGAIMGTASYMSPEQARGKRVDRRTDIWAFGCCLYEALTGRLAFDGETVTDILGAIVGKAPDLERVPASARGLVGKCLTKDAHWRLQHIGDARLELRESSVVADEHPVNRTWSLVIRAVLIASVVTGALVWSVVSPTSTDRPVRRLSVTIPETDRFGAPGGTMGSSVAISPDGRDLVYVANRGGNRQLFHRPLARSESAPILGTEGAVQPFFSPDGTWVAFGARGDLKKVSLRSGEVTTVVSSGVRNPTGATWGRDDTIVYTPSERQSLFSVSAQGGEPRAITDLEGAEASHRWPTILPGGGVLLYEAFDSGVSSRILAQVLETGERKVLLDDAHSPFYVPTGHIGFVRSRSIWAAPFDVARLELGGDPVPVLEDVDLPISWSAQLSFSTDGTLAYVSKRSQEVAQQTSPVWVSRDGAHESIIELYDYVYRDPRLSPDGRHLLLSSFGPDADPLVWMLELQRRTLSRFTTQTGMRAFWTPTGEEIVFASSRGGLSNIYMKRVDSGGAAQQLSSGEYRVPTSISPDGRSILFRRFSDDGDHDIGMLALGGNGEPELILHTEFDEHSAAFSPDGRWIAYVSSESGREEVYLRTFPELQNQLPVSTDGGVEPVWSRDGTELFYRSPRALMAVTVSKDDGLRLGDPLELFDDRYDRSGRPAVNYDVDVDARRFVMMQTRGNSAAQISVVLNWFEELERLVPTDD